MHTIVALSTGSIHGAIAIVRISGPDAVSIADILFRSARGAKLSSLPPRAAHFGELLDGDAAIDQVVATRYQAPRSYTGEDMVEFACHGSSFIVERLLQMAMAKGARMAERGEFTRRAFLNGKLDLAQAEAVADLINAQTAPQTQMAIMQLKGGLSKTIDTLKAQLLELSALLELELDFSEEDVEFADRSRLMQLTQQAQCGIERLLASYTSGNAVREGVRIVITGSPNAGKSSLLNALAQEEIALVSDIPGTTRDAIETTLRVNGLQFRLTDTAGLRQSTDPVERMGVQRAEQRIAQASALIVVVDATLPWEHIKRDISTAIRHAAHGARIAILLSKVDLTPANELEQRYALTQKEFPSATHLRWAAPTRHGEQEILQWLSSIAAQLLPQGEAVVVTSARHAAALSEARQSLEELAQSLNGHVTTDILAFQLRTAIDSLTSITGGVDSNAVLDYIFSRFCIGK